MSSDEFGAIWRRSGPGCPMSDMSDMSHGHMMLGCCMAAWLHGCCTRVSRQRAVAVPVLNLGGSAGD